ncbi:hypothetical protein KJ781_02840, partial [Patescibacteria group bacterium]|nr:hypothetical protein [Patescibacteria group bacterium]MBU1448971.1 hypothetical protein [Patescibacteria group bacterium]
MHIRRMGRFMTGLVLLSLLAGQGCTKGMDPATQAASKRTTLTIWSVIDDVDVYQGIISDYRALHPYVTVSYRRFRLEEYEDALLNALAEDRGPDIFLIHDTWISKYLPKIEPMPLQTTTAFQRVVGTVKKETTYVLETEPSVSVRSY